MKLELQHKFQAPQQELWDLLLDPQRLTKCIPGCESMQEQQPNVYAATLKIGVAAVKGTYVGRVEIRDQTPPSHYQLGVEGKAAAGFVKGLATMDLAQQGPRETQLSIKADVEVGGLIASVGQRFLGGIAKQMAGLFFTNIEKELLNGKGAA